MFKKNKKIYFGVLIAFVLIATTVAFELNASTFRGLNKNLQADVVECADPYIACENSCIVQANQVDDHGAYYNSCVSTCYDATPSSTFNAYTACMDAQNGITPQPQPDPQPQPAPTPTTRLDDDSQSIYKPLQDTRDELQTPGPAVSPPNVLDRPAVNVAYDATPNTDYYKMDKIKKNDTITAPINKSIEILPPGAKIDGREGSSIQNLGDNVWKIIKGEFRFVINHVKDKIFKVTTPYGEITDKGTKFLVKLTPEGVTYVTVQDGNVDVKNTFLKKKVNVSSGSQATVSKAKEVVPAKTDPTQDDHWYDAIAPSTDYLTLSWNTEAAADTNTEECTTTASQATATQTLNADELKVLDAFNQNLPKFNVKVTNSIIGKDKKIFIYKEKNNANGTTSGTIVLGPKNTIYYSGTKIGAWKGFKDKIVADDMFQRIHDQNITVIADKSTFSFDKWETIGNKRYAVFDGKLTETANTDWLEGLFGSGTAAGQDIGTIQVYMGEQSGMWSKYTMTTQYKSGKISIPLMKSCQLKYGADVKIDIPKKYKKIDVWNGYSEAVDVSKIPETP